MKKHLWIALSLVLVLACLAVGFRHWTGGPAPASPPVEVALTDKVPPDPEYLVRVTPAEFFSGELKRLKHHLDFLSAVCFKVKTQGPVSCRPDVEVWCDGERVDLAKYGYTRDDQSDEVNFTVRILEPNLRESVRYRAVVGGVMNFGRYLKRPESKKEIEAAFGPIWLEEPVEMKPGVESVIVWAMGSTARGGGDVLDLFKPEVAEKRLQELPWAMILRLRLEKDRS
jgi:hypothetical protein